MATRIRRQHQEEVRSKIRASQLINRLQDHVFGAVELSATQVTAASKLLDKIISNAPTEISGADGDPILPEAIALRFIGSDLPKVPS